MIDAGGQREKAFEAIGDIGLDVLRWHSGVERGDVHYGDLNGRKEIHRHSHQAGSADDQQDQANDEDEVRMTNREL